MMGEPATFFGYRELPKEPADAQWLFQEMIRIQHENGATWSRCTIVSDEHPLPPYQNGLYVEGWRKRPKNEGEFSFPVTDHPIAAYAPGAANGAIHRKATHDRA